MLGVLVPTKNLSFLCICCDHFHMLGRAVRHIGELGGGAQVTTLGTVSRVHCALPNMEMGTFANEK